MSYKKKTNMFNGKISSIRRKRLTTKASNPETEVTANGNASKKKKNVILDAALDVAKNVAPELISGIPGVGPILGKVAKGLLSTLNCDAWFGGHTPAGATFSEILEARYWMYNRVKNGSPAYTGIVDIVPTYAHTSSYFNSGQKVKNAVFPTILSYVRSKTNNVLIPETDQYWKAFYRTVELTAIYYTIRKYLKLAVNIPLNANTISSVIQCLDPTKLSDLRGIADSIEAYLKETTGLPHALQAYLRWRFGTTFHSENTGRPGLIFYDAQMTGPATSDATESDDDIIFQDINWHKAAGSGDIVQQLQTVFYQLQKVIGNTGRAVADLHLAYLDHQHEWDVENAHFDEKEYNLRMNQRAGTDLIGTYDNVLLLLDSRLDMSAAIQAVTLSTMYVSDISTAADATPPSSQSNLTPISTYPDRPSVLHMGQNPDWEFYNTMATPFLNTSWIYYLRDTSGFIPALSRQGITPVDRTNSWYRIFRQGFMTTNVSLRDQATLDREYTITSSPIPYMYNLLARYCAIALQMHENNVVDMLRVAADSTVNWPDAYSSTENVFQFRINPLSYDRAVITRAQLQAIQEMAMRNLIRGDYKYESKKDKAEELAKKEEILVEAIDPQVDIMMADSSK